jgi:hypothetical protein
MPASDHQGKETKAREIGGPPDKMASLPFDSSREASHHA